jgi:hypothetical protein
VGPLPRRSRQPPAGRFRRAARRRSTTWTGSWRWSRRSRGGARRVDAGWRDGRIKLLVTAAGLRLRRARPELFLHGAYVPLETEVTVRAGAAAFARLAGRARTRRRPVRRATAVLRAARRRRALGPRRRTLEDVPGHPAARPCTAARSSTSSPARPSAPWRRRRGLDLPGRDLSDRARRDPAGALTLYPFLPSPLASAPLSARARG